MPWLMIKIKKRKTAISTSRITIVTAKMSFDCEIKRVVFTDVLLDGVDETGGSSGVCGTGDGDCD